MFFKNIEEKLAQLGFHVENSGQNGIFLFLKRDGIKTYLINIVNLPEQEVDVHQLYYVLHSVKEKISKKYTSPVECLNVYVTDESSGMKQLCTQEGTVNWIINKSDNILIIYENQESDFCGCRTAFEEALLLQKGNLKTFVPYCTYGMVAVNIIIFLFMYVICSDNVRNTIYDLGALYWPSVFGDGQFYRMVTYMFLHADIQHVLNNMLLLFFAGAYVEEYMGKAHFMVIYFAAGFLAGAVSMGYNVLINNRVFGIGASGAIFGVVGAIAGLLLLSRRTIKQITPARLAFFIVLSLMNGFENKGIDNMAHIGGLVSGFLISLILILMKQKKRVESDVNIERR